VGEGAKRVTTEDIGELLLTGPLSRGIGMCSDNVCLAQLAAAYYTSAMKTLTVRLPEPLAAEIEAESRARRLSKSDVVRERLQRAPAAATDDPLASIRDLIGSVDGLPSDLSERKNEYLRAIIHGRKRPR
jgi:Arc/MetJ-type ribon-helix-helix transcriptional regulator